MIVYSSNSSSSGKSGEQIRLEFNSVVAQGELVELEFAKT